MIATIALMMLSTMTGAEDRCDAGEMVPLLKRHEIQVLLDAGFSVAEVAERAAVSPKTVRGRREQRVEHTDDRGEHRMRSMGRPSKVAMLGERVRGWLAEEPDLPTQELPRRAREHGYTGQKSAFYALVASIRPPRASPIVDRLLRRRRPSRATLPEVASAGAAV